MFKTENEVMRSIVVILASWPTGEGGDAWDVPILPVFSPYKQNQIEKEEKEVGKPEKNTCYGHYIPSDIDIKAQDEQMEVARDNWLIQLSNKWVNGTNNA